MSTIDHESPALSPVQDGDTGAGLAGDPAIRRLARLARTLLRVREVRIWFEDPPHPDPASGGPDWLHLHREVVGTGEPLALEDLPSHPSGAYLGIPLMAQDGRCVGSLSVYDEAPRRWGEDEVEVLRDLGRSVITEIELRREVQERRRAEGELREVAGKLQAIVAASPIAILSLDPEGRVQTWSPAAERMFGWTREEVLGVPNPALPADGEVHSIRSRALAGERLTGLEVQRTRRDGTPLEVSLSTAPLTGPEGEVQGTVVLLEDITERKRAAREAREGQERLRDALDTLPVGIFLTRPDGEVEWQNRAGRAIWGGARYAGRNWRGEYRGRWVDTGRPVEVEEWALSRALRGEAVSGQVIEIDAFDGRRRILNNSAYPLRDSTGEIVAAITVNEDITERVRAEASLRRNAAFLALLHEVASASNESSAPEGAIQLALDRICEHTGWTVGHAWLRGGSGGLVSTGLWHVADPARFGALRATGPAGGGRISGLAEQVAATGSAAWAVDAMGELTFLCGSEGRDLGIRAGFAFPLLVGSRVVGVLEFLSEGIEEPERDLVEVMTHVGTQLGRVVERRDALEALKESEERFRYLFEMSPVPEWVVENGTGAVIDVNEAALRNYGYTRGEFMALPGGELLPPGVVANASGPVAEWSGWPRRAATRFRRRDGTAVYTDTTVQDVRFAGRIAHMVVAVDVTEQRSAEDRLRFLESAGRVLGALFEYDERLESFARLAVPVLADFCAIDVVGEDGAIVRATGAHADPGREDLLRRLLKFAPRAEDSGNPAARALRTGETVLVPELTDEMLEAAFPEPEHLDALRKLGTHSLMAIPLAARGRTLGAITLVTGESKRRYGEADLSLAEEFARRAALLLDNSQLYRRARRAARAREEVLAVVSHEMRIPLNSIAALVETLLHWLPPDTWRARERRQLESVLQVVRQMGRLVQDLVDITRIESGHFAVRLYHEPAGSLVEESVAVLQPVADREEVRLEVAVEEGLPAVRADRQRISQVIANLAANAIRLTPPGGTVVVGAERRGTEVRFRVSDTGPGIAKENLPRLFQRFWRPEEAQGGGEGLGLAVARGIVEAHGGRIWAENNPGRGSTFHFTLPVGEAEPGSGELPGGPLSAESVVVLPELPPARESEARPRAEDAETPEEAAARVGRFVRDVAGRGGAAPELPAASLTDHLRDQIATAVHLGYLRPGDRLPSIREVARRFGVTAHAVVQAYEQLAAERRVEKRDRSGMYVAGFGERSPGMLGETALWVADVLVGACEHQIKIPQLPDLVRRLTSTARLRCTCVESDQDTLTALCAEAEMQFGLESRPVSISDLPSHVLASRPAPEDLPEEIVGADLLLTTAYHVTEVRAWADALGKPLVVVTANPEHTATVEQRVSSGTVTVVCVDGAFGERVRGIRGGKYRDRIRVVLADDAEALAGLDPSEPVFLTRAAHQRLEGVDLRLLFPLSPFLSPACSRRLVEVLLGLNVAARRV